METLEVVKKPQTSQKVELVRGEFTPSEARDILSSLIDVKVNFHKLQRLQRWEGQHNCDTGDLNSRIAELVLAEENGKEFIQSIREQGKQVKISGTLVFEIIE